MTPEQIRQNINIIKQEEEKLRRSLQQLKVAMDTIQCLECKHDNGTYSNNDRYWTIDICCKTCDKILDTKDKTFEVGELVPR